MNKYLPSAIALVPIVATAVLPQAQELAKANPFYSMVLAAVMAVLLHLAPSPLGSKKETDV